MSRRAAKFTQADVNRALKAAQQAGPAWEVLLEGSVIHIVRGATGAPEPVKVEVPVVQEEEPVSKWVP